MNERVFTLRLNPLSPRKARMAGALIPPERVGRSHEPCTAELFDRLKFGFLGNNFKWKNHDSSEFAQKSVTAHSLHGYMKP